MNVNMIKPLIPRSSSLLLQLNNFLAEAAPELALPILAYPARLELVLDLLVLRHVVLGIEVRCKQFHAVEELSTESLGRGASLLAAKAFELEVLAVFVPLIV
jgi:hypothetical protein